MTLAAIDWGKLFELVWAAALAALAALAFAGGVVFGVSVIVTK